jgi:hypothetical protein
MAMQCRFCLEGGVTTINKLIDPCACRGSAQYVHQLCLRKWIVLDPERNSKLCTVCKTPLNLQLIPSIEIIPTTASPTLFIVDQTLVSAMMFNFGYFAYLNFIGQLATADFKKIHVAFSILYTLAYIHNYRVQNRTIYRQRLVNSSFPYICSAYIFTVSRVFLYNDTSYLYLLYIIMNTFWREHVRILASINQELQ